MEKCGECGNEFDIDDARDEYTAHFNGELDYDYYAGQGEPGERLCGDCGIMIAESNIATGEAILGMSVGIESDLF